MALLDYRNIEELLVDYAANAEAGAVVIRDERRTYQPMELLQALTAKELKAPIVRIEGNGINNRITVRIGGLSEVERTFSIEWSLEREGWAFPHGFGRSIHYFVPKHRLKNPPCCGDRVLVSLCKRSFLTTTELFGTPDPKYSICKTCERNYRDLVRP